MEPLRSNAAFLRERIDMRGATHSHTLGERAALNLPAEPACARVHQPDRHDSSWLPMNFAAKPMISTESMIVCSVAEKMNNAICSRTFNLRHGLLAVRRDRNLCRFRDEW